MKITEEMVEYWYGSEIILPKDVIRDIVDIANGNYKVKMLKDDITKSWKGAIGNRYD
tara:strand:- start:248 stop:418 length:171 start_codon:yes stop_codon:yes gene_type:complete